MVCHAVVAAKHKMSFYLTNNNLSFPKTTTSHKALSIIVMMMSQTLTTSSSKPTITNPTDTNELQMTIMRSPPSKRGRSLRTTIRTGAMCGLMKTASTRNMTLVKRRHSRTTAMLMRTNTLQENRPPPSIRSATSAAPTKITNLVRMATTLISADCREIYKYLS